LVKVIIFECAFIHTLCGNCYPVNFTRQAYTNKRCNSFLKWGI